MESISELYIGIDLGTTNYSTAIYAKDKILVVENSEKERIGLSLVYFGDKNECIVGTNAKRRSYESRSERAVYGTIINFCLFKNYYQI